jgi:RNA polymerase sigma-70 factor (ECF subfamily)
VFAGGTDKIPAVVQVMDGQAVEDTRADIELLTRIAARDTQALAGLYDRHSRLLFGLILRILRDRSDAEEVLQEVFLTVWTKAGTYDQALGSPVAWLVRIARNRGIDRLRAEGVRTRSLEQNDVAVAATAAPEADNPESRAVRSDLKRGIARALEVLPTDQRELIEHAYYLGLSHSELAERFRLPLGTVKTRVRAGMQALRQHLEGKAIRHGG